MRSELVLALSAGLWLSACTAQRVSGYRLVPEPAYDFAESPEKLQKLALTAQEDLLTKTNEVIDRTTALQKPARDPTPTPQQVIGYLRRDPPALMTVQDRMDLVEMESLELRKEEYAEAHRDLEEARARGEILFTEKLFFTIEPLIAFDGDLATTAIPALGVNWRFLEKWKNPLAAQLVMGGALNPQASGSDVGAAIGLGISHPVSQKGSISIGYVWWDEAGDGQDGFYIGITLGDFGKKAGNPR
jgi:hypothetical protein